MLPSHGAHDNKGPRGSTTSRGLGLGQDLGLGLGCTSVLPSWPIASEKRSVSRAASRSSGSIAWQNVVLCIQVSSRHSPMGRLMNAGPGGPQIRTIRSSRYQ